MERVVTLVNRLHQICTALDDNQFDGSSILYDKLVSICVIGGQSSGKSSVLEAVVGRDFLPRGTGIVTRRPLVLQLVKEEAGAAEYGEFAHAQGRKFPDFDLIRQEIEAETDRHLGKSHKVVSPIPIYLTIYSPHVPNLTLVDLPGLTKVPIDGQPASIVQELEDMARNFVKGENTIILAVTPANADLATSDALRLAREVDPAGDRTVGVLTKLDIMDRGTDCRDVLLGRSLKLKHGWVAVVNRGQADLNQRVGMEAARAKEKEFFFASPAYRDLENIGMTYLADKLSAHLIAEILKKLPSITAHIDATIAKTSKELEALGSDVGANRGRMLHLILTLCQRVERSFDKVVEGGAGGGERILDVFDVKLKEAIGKLPFDKILTLRNVRNTINEADGYQPHIIAPEAGYRRLIEDGLSLFREPGARAVELTHQILKAIVAAAMHAPETRELQRFVNLKTEIVAAATQTLDKFKGEAEATVRTLVDMEGSYLSANFFREIVAAESVMAVDPSRPRPGFSSSSSPFSVTKPGRGREGSTARAPAS